MEFILTIFWVLYFVVASVISFYIPGRVILGKDTKFSSFTLNVLSVAVGIVIFQWQGYIFGALNIRWMTYLYLVVFLSLYIINKYYPKKIPISPKSIDKVSAGIIVVGAILQIMPYIRMGWMSSQGVIISAHNNGDHIWHATLINELVRRFPPYEPGIAGVILKDYHYFFNLITADLIRVFHLPLFTTQFIGMYVGGSILFGLLIYILTQNIYPSALFTRLSLFILYFAGNAAGWYMLVTNHTFDWSILSLIVDQTKFLDSPAYAYAIIVGFTGMIFLLQKKLTWKYVAIIALCFGSIIEYKVHVGIPFFAGFGCLALYALLKRNFKIVAAFVLAVVLGLCVFLPGISKEGGLAFIPFDIPRDFINQTKLGHIDWQLRWIIFQDHHNTPRIIQYGLMMSGVYFLVQYGLLLLGIIPYFPTLKKFKSFSIFLYAAIFVSTAMGLLFYQKVGGANIWEFFLASTPLLCLLLASHITLVIERRSVVVKSLVILLFAIIIIPQSVISLSDYLREEYFSPFHGLTYPEVNSYTYVAKNTPAKSIVLVIGQQNYVAYSSVVRLFIDRDLYLSGEGVRQQVTPIIAHRRQVIKEVETMNDPEKIAQMLKNEHIAYLYIYNGMYPGIYGDREHLVKVFSNSFATIYKVQ